MTRVGKLVLFSAVGLAHAAVLFSSPFQLDSFRKLDSPQIMVATFVVLKPLDQLLKSRLPLQGGNPALHSALSPKLEKQRASLLPSVPAEKVTPDKPTKPAKAATPSNEELLHDAAGEENVQQNEAQIQAKSEEPDETALPPDDIGEMLQQALPFAFGLLVLDFSIDSAGNTIAVECVEGDCNPAVIDSLKMLTHLIFRPAISEGVAVASRKSIQVEATHIF